MKSSYIAAVCLSVPFIAAAAQPDRIGTFDKQSIVIAFYRSPMWADTLKERIAARDSAKRAGDTVRVRQLEEWGASHQELAHRQLAGTADLTNIVDALRPALDSLISAERLKAIVPAPVTDVHMVVVDVTPKLLDWLKADAKTREIIASRPPGS